MANIYTIAGNSRQLQCQTSAGVPAPRVKWFMIRGTPGSKPTDITTSSNSMPDESGTTSVLTVVPTRDDDGLTIYCTADNVGESVESVRKPLLHILCK